MAKILITGGSGLIGEVLTELLLSKGHEVVHLSRNKNSKSGVKVYLWNVKKEWIADEALEGVNIIIHLAGANIANTAFDEQGKNILVDSRVKSAQLLYTEVKKRNIDLRLFLSASAVGYYGMDYQEDSVNEESIAGSDFVAKLCMEWESAADKFQDICRVAKVRIGLVLDKNEGVLKALSTPAQFGLAAAVGNGKQWMPWIHKTDLAGIFNYLIENEHLEGVYNGVAPEDVRNKSFIKAISKAYGMPMILPNIPKAFINLIFGEKADLLLEGKRVSGEKINNAGYRFVFQKLEHALNDLIKD